MGISDIADGITRRFEGLGSQVSETLFEPVIRVGVTGLSRAGKTVFITSLVANLLDRGRMPALSAASDITAAFLQPQPDDTVPRFDLCWFRFQYFIVFALMDAFCHLAVATSARTKRDG